MDISTIINIILLALYYSLGLMFIAIVLFVIGKQISDGASKGKFEFISILVLGFFVCVFLSWSATDWTPRERLCIEPNSEETACIEYTDYTLDPTTDQKLIFATKAMVVFYGTVVIGALHGRGSKKS